MKRIISSLVFASTALVLLNSYSGQAPASGHTGSPGDNRSTCASSSCHISTATPVNNMISTTIPSTGYVPGATYDVSFTISESGRSKFGFQITSEDGSGNKKGTFKATSATQIQNNGAHITHKSTSTSGTDSKTWTVQWVAPSSGSGNITFYGAGNATNGRGDRTGDLIKTSTHSVSESTTTGLVETKQANVSFYPNPASENITVKGLPSDSDYAIVGLNGQTVLSGQTGSTINVSSLQKGIYFLQIPSQNYSERLIVN